MDNDLAEKYPEHAKLTAVQEKTQAIHDFLEWLSEPRHKLYGQHEDEYPVQLASPFPDSEWRMHILSTGERDKLMAEFHGIDMNVIEKEKQAMLDELRAANNG